MTEIAANSPFALFETDADTERQGITLDYGKFYLIVARAGGSNARFGQVLRQKMQPHRRAIDTETMDDKLADKLTVETFAETVVLGWGYVTVDEATGAATDHPGEIVWRDGSTRTFSVEAVKELFALLPDLAKDVIQQATKVALFRKSLAEIDGKN